MPAHAEAAAVEVSGTTLRVRLAQPDTGTFSTGAQVHPVAGGAIVSLHGNLRLADRTAGPGCQEVGAANAPQMPGSMPGAGGASFAATCSLEGVRVVEGQLGAIMGRQGWLSSINLPTNVTSISNLASSPGGDKIVTGGGGDRITGGSGDDTIDAGGAPDRDQEAPPKDGTAPPGEPLENLIDGGGGNDTFLLSGGTGRDIVTGGAGTDVATYADRFTVGVPGSTGVHVTLDGQANDGDPNLVQPDTFVLGEGDNIGTDVENLTGTKRNDRLIGNGLPNVLFGDEGVDTLTGANGEDTLIAREPPGNVSGTADVINCGAPPTPIRATRTRFGVIRGLSGSDRLEADLADPKPANCELLVDMAVDEPAAIKFASRARRAGRNRLRVKLTCPRAAKRRCRGTLRLAGRRSGSRTARFSIRRGGRRTVTLRLSARAAAALARPRVAARLVSNETGLEGPVNRVALVRVR